MSKRTIYSIITPLPATVSRETAIQALHNYAAMIQLNPLVIEHGLCKAPAQAPPDEFHAVWYQLTDRISYLPGVRGKVSYKACFHDLPKGLQTHVYAPAGLEIKEKWSIGGNEPGEEREVMELGLVGVPRDGLYLREDVDMSCNIFLTSFVKKNLRRAHSVLVDRLVVQTDLHEDYKVRAGYGSTLAPSFTPTLRSPSVATSTTRGHKNIEVSEMPGSLYHPQSLHRQPSWGSRSVAGTASLYSSGSVSDGSNYAERRLSRLASNSSPYVHSDNTYQQPYPARHNSLAQPDAARYTDTYRPPTQPRGPYIMAELPAEEDAVPYERQQSFHMDQIRDFFDEKNPEWVSRMDSVQSIGMEEKAPPVPPRALRRAQGVV